MKKSFLITTVLALLLLLPVKAQKNNEDQPLYCGVNELFNAQYKEPYFQSRVQKQDAAIRAVIPNIELSSIPPVTIPVVVHVVYNPGNPVTNISDQQIIDQIAALNNEFNVVNNTGISFCLAQILPDQTTNWLPLNGTGTPGITRTSDADISSHNAAWEMGLLNSVAVSFDPQRYLNIWVVESITTTFAANVLGYAPKPIIPTSILDGIVIRYDVFGDNTFCGCYNLFGPYQQGKVLVHEAGHYLGVYHPFQRGIFDIDPSCQNNNCTIDGDLCCDTPPCWNPTVGWNGATYGCPGSNMNSCTTTNADNNYMEYTDDACKSVFTTDQVTRMFATITVLRSVLVSPQNLVYTGVGPQCGAVAASLVPDFYVPATQVCTGGSLTYTPVSSNNTATSFTWNFPGGTPSSSSSSSPVTVAYNTAGIYTSTLTVTDGSNTASYPVTIYVADCSINDPTQSNWYFGDHASLLFSTSSIPVSPVPPPSSSYSLEGMVSLSGTSGTALFYSNSQEVYEAAGHTLMPGGPMNGSINSPTGEGEVSAAQGSVSFPNPANANEYYIFTVSDIGPIQNQLHYSIVNITSNTITTLDVPVGSAGQEASEHLAAVPDCDDQGYWVITHGINGAYNDDLLAYHVTSSGVSNTPVTSSSFSYIVNTPNSADAIGQLDVSQDGSRMALTNNAGICQLYNFDKQTGACQHVATLPNGASMYSCSFSPGGEYLYTLAAGSSGAELRQWDLSSWGCGNNFSPVTIAQYGIYTYFNSLQLGPDNKIYITTSGDNKVSVINFPDQGGPACGFNFACLSMVQQVPFFGLPNMVDAKHNPTPEIRYCAVDCNTFNFYSTGCGTTYSWDFGDGIGTSTSPNPAYTYTAVGTYTVTLTINSVTVTPVVVNVTSSAGIYAINYDNPKECVLLDPVTGAELQTIAVLPGLINSLNGSSTYDPNHNRFIFSAASSAGSYYSINVSTGTVSTFSPTDVGSEFEYDVSLNRMFGINMSGAQRQIAEFDPASGAMINVIMTMPAGRNLITASSTYDQANHIYIFRAIDIPSTGNTYHYRFNTLTNVVSITTFVSTSAATEYEINSLTGNLYSFAPANPTVPTLERIDPMNGSTISTITSFPGLVNTMLGCTTFDPQNNTYYFCGSLGMSGVAHYVVDASAGTFTQTAQLNAYGEYQFVACAPVCSTCRFANPEQESAQNSLPNESPEMLTVYPNPSGDATTFSCMITQEGIYSMVIYDVSGKRVDEVFSMVNLAPGTVRQNWNTSSLNAGVYTVKLTGPAGTVNCKMIITR